ncbi:MAG: sulfotransferase family 2 domain-containing protein [Syntrophobacteraceae bacterium]|nr:sulfotransferase family 2 domain-containing protein [Syntrophobacteraceae bacterium]
MESGKTLIFLHLPKTAGTTLNSILDREYGKKRTLVINGVPSQCVSQLAAMPIESRRDIMLLRGGHFSFGIHQLLPSATTYITILRDPVKRVVSNYYHVLETQWHPLYEKLTSSRMSLEEYVTSGIAPELDNGQTRRIAGVEGIPFGQCTESSLAEATANMDRYFSFVGLTEFFDESLIRMSDILGWRKRPIYVDKLRNKKKPPLISIPDKTIAIIRQLNDLDCRLYDQVRSQFEKTDSPEMIDEIRKFRRVNMLYRAMRKAIAFQNSIHRPIVKKVERFLKSHRNRPS